jgi:hypothetical protein
MASSSKFVGYHFFEKKNELVDFDKKTFKASLKARVFEYLHKAREEHILPICQQFGKDELLDSAKVFTNKPLPRVINGHDIAYNIFLRMLFGDLVNMLVDHHTATDCVAGINPLSVDWKILLDKVSKFPNIIEGDLSKQEATTGHMFSEGFLAFVNFHYNISEAQFPIYSNVIEGLNGYIFVRGSDAYRVLRGHSSGHFLTFLYNSHQVWSGHKYAFEICCPDLVFEDHVSLKTGGDDSKGSVSDEAASRYNMTSISHVFKECFGMKYTGSDKEAEVPPFVNPENSTFLGRSFIHDPDNDRILPKLRLSAIVGLLSYNCKVPNMTEKEAIQLRADCAFQEMSLYSRQDFDKLYTDYFTEWSVRGVKVGHLVPKIHTYDYYRTKIFQNWYKSNSDSFGTTFVDTTTK